MDVGTGRLRGGVEEALWPLVETLLDSHHLAGLAVAVVREEEVVTRGFGVRDVGSGAPVTPETMFHLASVSKPVVATAIVSLASARDAGGPVLDLDGPITDWVPELTLADGRAGEITARRLLSHSSGLPDVADYGWHDPQLGDDALGEFARSLSGWRLQAEPGSAFAYSNAGFELLGLLLSRVTGTTFENAVRQRVLAPLGMRNSTFMRSEVPGHLAASPHVGMPLSVPEGAYPYTRRHAPSSTLHSNLVELCRWMVAHLEPADVAAGGPVGEWVRLDTALLDLMWQPVVPVGNPPWEEAAGLGWSVGSYRGHRTLSHSGADPGFGSRLVLVPERRTGVVVLANSNTVPTFAIAAAALDIALAGSARSLISRTTPEEVGEGVAAMRALLPPVVGPVAEALATSGPDAAASAYHRLAAAEPAAFDLDDDGFVKAVWGAIELHRTSLVRPLLRLWTELRPESSPAWTMTGWAHQVDGHLDQARRALRRALDLDPENDEAAQILSSLSESEPKQVVRRLVDEVMNRGDLRALDDLYVPRLATAARRWIEPFLASFSDVEMRIVELIAEGETVVGRFACSGTHTGPWLGHPPTGQRFEDVDEVYFFRVVDGRVARAWGLEDTHERLRQLGLGAEGCGSRAGR